MQTITFKAMGSEIEVLFPNYIGGLNEFLPSIFEEQEARFSRFRESSTLSILNKKKTLYVSENFWNLFQLTQRMVLSSQGAFNPLVSVKRLGYVSSYVYPTFDFQGPCDVDFNAIEFDASTRRIELKHNQELDFGGIAKGWAVDCVVKSLRALGVRDFVVNAGGDLYASGLIDGEPWKIALEGSSRVFSLSDQALATSGGNRRRWVGMDGRARHHIVNVSTLDSARNSLTSISVIGKSVAECDAWATAAFSLGKDEGQQLLIRNKVNYALCL
jgi:FAD:protein FMN transferase